MLTALLEAADPRPGERVVDVGCGAGTTTLAVAERVAPGGHVVGVDVSPPLIAEFARRAGSALADRPDLDVRWLLADAEDAALPGPFDLLVSRMGVMFFADQVQAWRNLRRAMTPGGRAAVVVWQEQAANPWMTVPGRAALAVSPPDLPPAEPGEPGPHGLADRSQTAGRLAAAGWVEIDFRDLRVPMELGRSVDDAVEQVRGLGSVAGAIDRVGPDLVLPAVRAALAPYASPDGRVTMEGAAWVVTARA